MDITSQTINYSKRLQGVRDRLTQLETDILLVTGRENTRYLSGFTGTESYLAVLPDELLLLVDFRYLEQAAAQAPHARVIDYTADRIGRLAGILTETGCHRLGVEEDELSWGFSRQILEKVPSISLQPAGNLLNDLRSVKDANEVAMICRAIAIAEQALQDILPAIRTGTSENAIAARLEGAMRAQGASGPSFATIVASGPRSALPHGVASDRILTAGDTIVLDFGCIWQGYCSDMTRTVFLGYPGEQALNIYDIVLAAQTAALAALRAGISGIDGDRAARDIISNAGYASAFGHGLGHGVGLAIHEMPRLSQSYTAVLLDGQIVTVEPGIYLPGNFGVRIEDMALVQADGCRNLNTFTKAPLILPR